MSRKHTQSGFGLIEILITLVVLGVGLIAIANLQGKLFQNSAAARDRVAAVNLAQKKLEDLRNFTQVDAGAGAVFGFAEIADDAGGMKADDGSLLLASGAQPTIGTTDYTLSWVVDDWAYPSDNSEAVASATPDFKRVTITVSWDGLDGGGEVEITGSVNALSPSSSARTVAQAAPRQGPIVKYTPGAAPDYVPIDISDTTKKETSTPEPVVSQNAQFTLTSFDEISYDTVFQTQRRDEYITVNCVCEQDGFGDGREPTLEIYDDETERLNTIVGEVVNKRIGARVTTGQDGQQPELCNTCCRDHHDKTASTYKYDPFRPVEPTLDDGDHDHYFLDDAGVLELANDAGDLYREACRFRRVDGYLRLMPDWNLATLQIMPALFVASNTTDYVEYVQDFVEEYVSGINDDGSNYPVAYPSPDTAFPNEPLEQAMGVNQTDQLIARGVYIDYMNADLIAEIKARISASENFLDIVPFHEVNLTRFANWSSVTASGGGQTAVTASVTDESLQDGGTNSRGFVTAHLEGEAYIRALIENDNTGLTDTDEIDPHTLVPAEEHHRDDEIKLTIGGVAPPIDTATVAGVINVKGGSVKINTSAVTVTGSGGAACVKLTDATYNCVLDADGNGTVTFGNYNDEKKTGVNITVNNHQITPSVFAGAVVTVANDGTLAETTSFAFTGAAVVEITLDILVSD